MDYLLLFLAGLAAAPHCLGMCGGFAAACALAGTPRPGAAAPPQAPHSGIRPRGGTVTSTATPRPPGAREGLLTLAAYHLGRLTTYSLLGAVMGAAGSFTAAAGRLAGWQGLPAAVAGLLLLAWSLARLRGRAALPPLWPSPLSLPGGRRLARIWRRHPTPGRALLLGLLLGFLPCGLLAVVELRAAGTARPLAGLATMLAFGLGTVPGLALGGSALALALGRDRRERVGTALLGASGLLSLLRGLAELGAIPHLHPWLW